MVKNEPTTTMRLNDYDLRILGLALRGYVEGVDGEYDDDHVHMDVLGERIRLARRRLSQKRAS